MNKHINTFLCKKCNTSLDISILFCYEYSKKNDEDNPTYELNAKCPVCKNLYQILASFPKEVTIGKASDKDTKGDLNDIQ